MFRLRGRGPARSRAAAFAFTMAGLAAAVAGCGTGQDHHKLHGFTRTPPPRVGDVGLPDVSPGHGGRRMAFRAAPGGLLLVYFGYTSCPDVCPTTLSDLGRALKALPGAQRRMVSVGMVTVDPARDTRTVLNGYLGHFLPAWHALRTTSTARLRGAERAFNAYSRLGPKDRTGNYAVVHTAEVYAVDEGGTVEAEWPFGTSPADLAADLRTLLRAEHAQPA